MQLFYTPNSPYARRPVLAVREFDLPVELVDTSPLTAEDSLVRQQGPGGKVPGLLTDEGVYICETLLILHHFNTVSGGKLYPGDAAARGLIMQIEGVSSLLMDSLFLRSHENRRDPSEQSPGVIEKEAARAARCYDELESLVDRFGDGMHMGKLSTAAALGYADGRHPGDNWRDGRPKLTAWNDEMLKRPAVAETVPHY